MNHNKERWILLLPSPREGQADNRGFIGRIKDSLPKTSHEPSSNGLFQNWSTTTDDPPCAPGSWDWHPYPKGIPYQRSIYCGLIQSLSSRDSQSHTQLLQPQTINNDQSCLWGVYSYNGEEYVLNATSHHHPRKEKRTNHWRLWLWRFPWQQQKQ